MSDELKSQIQALLGAQPASAPAASAPAAPTSGLNYDELAAALLRAGGGRPQGAPAAPAQQSASSLADLLGRRPSGPSVSDAGSPAAPARFTDDTPLLQLSPEDRAHLVRTKGGAWFNATLRSQLRGTRVALKR